MISNLLRNKSWKFLLKNSTLFTCTTPVHYFSSSCLLKNNFSAESIANHEPIPPLSTELIHQYFHQYPKISKTLEFENGLKSLKEQQLLEELNWISSQFREIICSETPLHFRSTIIFLYDYFREIHSLYHKKSNKNFYLKPTEFRYIFYAQLKNVHIYTFLNEFYNFHKEHPISKFQYTVSDYVDIFKKFRANKLEADRIPFFKNENLKALCAKEKNFGLYFYVLSTCEKFGLPSEVYTEELNKATKVLDWSLLEGWFCQYGTICQFYRTNSSTDSFEAREFSVQKKDLVLKLRAFLELKVTNVEEMTRFLQIGNMHINSYLLADLMKKIHLNQFRTRDFTSATEKAKLFLEVTCVDSYEFFEYKLEDYIKLFETNMFTTMEDEALYKECFMDICRVLFHRKLPTFRSISEQLITSIFNRLKLRSDQLIFLEIFKYTFSPDLIHFCFVQHLINTKRIYLIPHYLDLYKSEIEFQAQTETFVPYQVPILLILRSALYVEQQIDFSILVNIVETQHIPINPDFYLLYMLLKHEQMSDNELVDFVNRFSKQFKAMPDRIMILENLAFLLYHRKSFEKVQIVLQSATKNGIIPFTSNMGLILRRAQLLKMNSNAALPPLKNRDFFLLRAIRSVSRSKEVKHQYNNSSNKKPNIYYDEN